MMINVNFSLSKFNLLFISVCLPGQSHFNETLILKHLTIFEFLFL